MYQGVIRRNWRTFYAVLAMMVDSGVLAVGFVLSARIDNHDLAVADVVVAYHHLLFYSIALFLGLSTALGIYRTISYSAFPRQLFQAGKAFMYVTAIVLSSLFLTHNLFYTRNFLLVYLLLTPGLYLLTWTMVRMLISSLQKKGYGRWNTLAIGADADLKHLMQRVEEYPELGYDIVSVLKVPMSDRGTGKVHVEPEVVESLAVQKNIGLIVLSSANLNGSFDQIEGLCRARRIGMRVVSPQSDYLFSKARLHDIAGIPLFTPERRRIDFFKTLVKRVFDIVGSSVSLMILSPLLLLVAIATRLESHGPVLFTQKRSLTDRDEPFDFYKFRSMFHEADEQKESLLHKNEATGALFKIKNDPRLTKVGKLIRKYSIDELPQLFNVLKGDMSLVGPRPLPATDFALLEEEDHMGGYFHQRAKAKPGMTGLWQISGRSDLGFREMVLLDLYYIEHQTILYDIEILAQTIPVVLFGRGAY
jgi:exopolysaccharide biosynthesis polyprenyl glycosylphosphotransferase